MKIVFADTFYWIALINVNDESHAQAIRIGQMYSDRRVVVTDAVVDEVLNYFASKGDFLRMRAFDLSRRIDIDPDVLLIKHREDLRRSGLRLYYERPDKGYSLTDCISMVVMKQMGISEVLTQDKHFAQEGFTILF